jgi:hypothetical protein
MVDLTTATMDGEGAQFAGSLTSGFGEAPNPLRCDDLRAIVAV